MCLPCPQPFIGWGVDRGGPRIFEWGRAKRAKERNDWMASMIEYLQVLLILPNCILQTYTHHTHTHTHTIDISYELKYCHRGK